MQTYIDISTNGDVWCQELGCGEVPQGCRMGNSIFTCVPLALKGGCYGYAYETQKYILKDPEIHADLCPSSDELPQSIFATFSPIRTIIVHSKNNQKNI